MATPKKSYQFGQMMQAVLLAHSFDVLDEFRSQLGAAWTQSQQRLREEYTGLSAADFESEGDMEDYQSFLQEDYAQLDEVKRLGDALIISGLYGQVEIQVHRVLKSTFPTMGKDKRANILLGGAEPEMASSKLVDFDALDELRMLNNIIKHEGSNANAKLAAKYPTWVANEKLSNLDKAYQRLRPLVEKYLQAFIREAFANSDAFDAAPVK